MPAMAGRFSYMAASTQSEKVGGGGSRKKGGRGGAEVGEMAAVVEKQVGGV